MKSEIILNADICRGWRHMHVRKDNFANKNQIHSGCECIKKAMRLNLGNNINLSKEQSWKSPLLCPVAENELR